MDHNTNEVNATKLAEESAAVHECSEVLDDETHEIWNIALEVAQEREEMENA